MKVKDFLQEYKNDGLVGAVGESVRPNESRRLRIKGLSGSLDAILLAALYSNQHQTHIIVLHEKEEAAYFHYDLQQLLPKKDVLLFPTSHKRPYSFDETENANVLQRAEVLNRINNKSPNGEIIVTYPEALCERVINRKSLIKNTFSTRTGEKIDLDFLSELLITYDFDKTDFVYEPGQFAVRGGIIDVFSFAHEYPYRIELFGDEVESIRTFDAASQLSMEPVNEIHIIPNIQTKLIQEERQSFGTFLPRHSKFWFKDYEHTLDVLAQGLEKATGAFEKILQASGATQVVMKPEALFDGSQSFEESITNLVKIDFGQRSIGAYDKKFSFHTSPQPSFNKDFNQVAEALTELTSGGYQSLLAAEVPKQLERLDEIFREIAPGLKYEHLNIPLRGGFIDHELKLACFTDHQIFERFHRYKTQEGPSKSKALTLRALKTLQPGDFVTHIDYGIGRFAGMDRREVNGKVQEVIRLLYRDDDLLYISIHGLHKISKYSGREGTPPAISKLGSQDWENKKKKVKKKVADIAKDLIGLYAKRKQVHGFAFSPDSYLQAELESSFMYDDTPDQAKATADVKEDMEQPHPMDRLVCGDVGFGKTEVAIRAAFKSVADSKQVAILVPTTILAMQHYRTFKERLEKLPVTVAYINRFRSANNIRETLKKLKEGTVDIIIGTHRLVNKDVVFKDLGLLIIDEEQKFGVKTKERLKEMRVNVDVLTLTATPIPRTLHFSLMGARDLSIIATPPPNRQPVTTEVHTFNDILIRDVISFELRRGGQVFFVHNRVHDIESVANIILKLVPDASIGIAHGQMDGTRLEKTMVKFIEGEFDVLVSTNIIESGLDIPNANTIIINQAQTFGLSDLHQMRGRVGRSNKKAFCYLMTPPTIQLSSESRKRLTTLEEFSELGDGFKVAMRDLDIRGAGNLLGAEQSGFITDLGFDMYHKILDEAVQELKETEFKGLFTKELKDFTKPLVQECALETDLEVLIPEDYVGNISERLNLYNQLDNLKNQEELTQFIISVTDRFGPMPDPVMELMESVRLRWLAEGLGFEKITLKNNKLKGYVPSEKNDAYFKSAAFGQILDFVRQHPRQCKLQEHKDKLILHLQDIGSFRHGIERLEQIQLVATP